jgi:hypothetical protein
LIVTCLAVITPSLSRDFQLFCDLHHSVLEFMPEGVVHHVVTPRQDVEVFRRLRSSRCVVWSQTDLLPRRFVHVPWGDKLDWFRSWEPFSGVAAVNLRHPFPPIRNWIMQQLVKLAVATHLDADVLLIVDSDVVLVRPVTAETFSRGRAVRLYRKDGEVDRRLPAHLKWDQNARRLLGLPGAEPPLPEYTTSLWAADRRLVVRLLHRIEAVNDGSWADVLGAQLHLSETVLYGLFVEELVGGTAASFVAHESLCHSYWQREPLDAPAATDFVNSTADSDVAILIQSTSLTPIDVRRAAIAQLHPRP